MAGRQYLTNPNTPFFSVEEDDVDDDTFLRHSQSGSSGYMLPNSSYSQERSSSYRPQNYYDQEREEDKRLQLLERKKAIEERTIQSSERSLTLLRDSEQIGVATAESVFGSLKNYLSGKSGEVPPPSAIGTRESEEPSGASGLATNSLKIRGLDDDGWDRPSPSTGTQNVNQVLDRNLDDMCSSLSRLKGLAQDLGGEIDTQNDLLGRLNDKTDKADFNIMRQNKEMGRILKKN
ncbi:hypothetical protein C0J52_15313 [Blattella germanica]|nr:hypothetical protein C0J52_15313 [Blattella germanica]